MSAEIIKPSPIISEIQKLYVYQTYTRLYLVGSDHHETIFHILKIDRTDVKELIIHEEQVAYNFEEIKDILQMVDLGNRTKFTLRQQNNAKHISAYGVVGFVRFLFGYYVILITKRLNVGFIGHHNIYKIQDTHMMYIPNDQQALQNSEEQRFVKIFQTIDLSSNFYYSYGYDLTHSLQFNIQKDNQINQKYCLNAKTIGYKIKPCWQYVWNRHLIMPWQTKAHCDWYLYIIHGYFKQVFFNILSQHASLTIIARRSSFYAGTRYLKRGISLIGGYTANSVETEQILQDLTSQSMSAYVQFRGSIPTFWSQESSKMVPKPPIMLNNTDPFCIASGAHFHRLLKRYGTPIVVLNLAKKDTKRGEGVLTEEYLNALTYLNQFLPDSHKILYQGFDMAKMNRNKSIDVITKLVEDCHQYVTKTNIFVTCSPFSRQSEYNNNKNEKFNKLFKNQKNNNENNDGNKKLQTGLIRTNCVDCLDRTNTAQFVIGKCALALQLSALNLYPPGVSDSPSINDATSEVSFGGLVRQINTDPKLIELSFDSDIVRLLEDLYEEQGDVLALQYGGSQLVHRVDTYRKISPSWTYHSRDMMQTFSRYYSNTFSDAEKQDAINLFLGAYVPALHYPPAIWELTNDFHLHNSRESNTFINLHLQNLHLRNQSNNILTCNKANDDNKPIFLADLINVKKSFSRWFDPRILKCLPLPYEQVACDNENEIYTEVMRFYLNNHRLDSYFDFYKPNEITSFDHMFSLNILNNIRDYMPTDIVARERANSVSASTIPNSAAPANRSVPAEPPVKNQNENNTNEEKLPRGLYASKDKGTFPLVGDGNFGLEYTISSDKYGGINGQTENVWPINLTVPSQNLASYKCYLQMLTDPCSLNNSTLMSNDSFLTNRSKPNAHSKPIYENTSYEVTISDCPRESLNTYAQTISLSNSANGLSYVNYKPDVRSIKFYKNYIINNIY